MATTFYVPDYGVKDAEDVGGKTTGRTTSVRGNEFVEVIFDSDARDAVDLLHGSLPIFANANTIWQLTTKGW